MRTLRERDIALMEIQEKHRQKIINHFLERRAGRVGNYSLLEQFLEVDKEDIRNVRDSGQVEVAPEGAIGPEAPRV